jgi:hypothetical protein
LGFHREEGQQSFDYRQTAGISSMGTNKPPGEKKNKADEAFHKPAKHIEETARLASSVEKAKDIGKVPNTKD